MQMQPILLGEYRTKRVFALLTPEIRGKRMAQMLQKPVFALPGCQRMSVNTLLCDTLGLANSAIQNTNLTDVAHQAAFEMV